MRLKIMDRVLSAITGVIILVIGVGIFVFGTGIFPFTLDLSFLTREYVFWQRAVMVAAAVMLGFLGLRGISMLFRSGRERGFIAQHTEYGDLSISMSAMENMVRKCVDSHEELKVTSTRIHHVRDGVVVNIRIALANGINIPITVSALQKQIKQYITSCSGVDVRGVRVMVETNNAAAPVSCVKADETLTADADAAEKAGKVVDSLHTAAQNAMPKGSGETKKPKREPFHQRLFKHEEKPQIIPQPPVAEPPQDGRTKVAETEPVPTANARQTVDTAAEPVTDDKLKKPETTGPDAAETAAENKPKVQGVSGEEA
ncbi:MAG: alkaline shock response membrane anchor protein AmaP [Eubacteriales bacterium]|nr:alkaline shock response membrane anchor protein AmaP [Eubacteriales bacterium]